MQPNMTQQYGFYHYYVNPVVCPHCGARNPKDTKVCNFCKKEISEQNKENKKVEPKEVKKEKKKGKWWK